MNTAPLVSVRHLEKQFPVGEWRPFQPRESVKALDDVSFDIRKGETFGLVGESGCGKSTVARVMLGLIPPSGGQVHFDQHNIFNLDREALRLLRKRMQIIFQDPFSSLDPRKTIEKIVAEPLTVHRIGSVDERRSRVRELLGRVGLTPAAFNRYPHEFSGGQRQRIAIARALALDPDLIVCDEPVSALDVSIQAQVLNLLKQLQRDIGLTYLFISHDLSVVKHISDRVGVMYLGSIIEIAPVDDLFRRPMHPYTLSLMSALPVPDPRAQGRRVLLQGDVPNPIHPPDGCRFHTRCFMAERRCRTQRPGLKVWGEGHQVACHLADRSNHTLKGIMS
ncbi:ABC transporter ATP-binding protein [Desulfosarcina alkanivorans]|uniref:ABC transporter ATP-binding protein n=1 Tax=Desulfosarcina alkanivorans TaxID=571177 RepID=A0A5K7Z363_9BACT|nr:dipeptide ABC transporter ATP-binding protein [Desulfosarcina alkanivorans]BBO71077.1 ABC transporter ATP-binding protein [Desulfosarcina alkanivorans]